MNGCLMSITEYLLTPGYIWKITLDHQVRPRKIIRAPTIVIFAPDYSCLYPPHLTRHPNSQQTGSLSSADTLDRLLLKHKNRRMCAEWNRCLSERKMKWTELAITELLMQAPSAWASVKVDTHRLGNALCGEKRVTWKWHISDWFWSLLRVVSFS